jgi:acyl-CoA thioester hydrolase
MIDQNKNSSSESTGQCDSHATFILPIRVYYEDTDAGGVVYHSNYISFFERARTEWMRQLGYELDELARDEQLIFVVRALSCEYLLPAKFNDELFVSAEILELGKTSIQFEQKIMRASKQNTNCEVLTKGIVTVVAVDSIKFKPKRLPKNIKESIESVI